MKSDINQIGTTIIPTVLAVISFLLVVGIGYSIINHPKPKTSPVAAQPIPMPKNNYAILSPATVPSKVAECHQDLTYASNGDPSPTQCTNGDLNIEAWNAVSAQELTVMRLSYNATPQQVTAAICADGKVGNQDASVASSAPIENTGYQLATLYYGWTFKLDPTAILTGGGC